MANKHAVVRTDNMHGTDVRAELLSVKFQDAEGKFAEIENGNVVKVGGLITDTEGAVIDREIFAATAMAGTEKIGEVALIASVEMMYDERKKNLDEFINEAGKPCRAYRLHSGAMYSVTEEALDKVPTVGQAVGIAAGTKLAVETGTAIGKVIAIEKTSRYTYYVIKID